MGKSLVFIFGILLVFGSFVIITTGADAKILDHTIELHEGWNLISAYAGQDISPTSSKRKGIIAAYIYDPHNQEYIRAYPNVEKNNAIEIYAKKVGHPEKGGGDYYDYFGFVNSAMWIYLNSSQTKEFSTFDGPAPLNYVGLKSGWNFLTVTPEMVEKKFNSIMGTCNIELIYLWDSDNQVWKSFDISQNFEEKFLWKGVAIKSSSDCILGPGGFGDNHPMLQ